MAKTTIEIEVEVNENVKETDTSKAFEFVSIKLPGGQSIPLPPDKPAPRRLARDIAAVAGYKLRGEKNPNVPEEAVTEGDPNAPKPVVMSTTNPAQTPANSDGTSVTSNVVNPKSLATPNPNK